MFAKYFTCNSEQKADHETSQDNESAREELGAWKEEINWNNCLLEWWICYRYYGYSQQNHFAGSTIACLNQSLHFRLMWNPEILDLWRIFSLQVRKLWRNSPFTGPNRKTCMFTWNSEYLITCFYFFISLSFWYIYVCIIYVYYISYIRIIHADTYEIKKGMVLKDDFRIWIICFRSHCDIIIIRKECSKEWYQLVWN